MLLLETTSTSTSSAASSPPTSTIASSSSSPSSSAASSTTAVTSNSTLSHYGLTMLTTGANQYIQPDYLSPLPTTLDAKRSPLALLAQTCSQIGADPIPASSSTSTSSMLTSTVSSSMSNKATGGADKPSAAKKADSEKSSSNRKTPPSSLAKDEKSGFKSPGSKPATSSPSGVTAAATSAFTPSADTKLSEAQRAALDALAAQQQQLAKDISPLGASLGAYRPMFSSLPSLPGIHPAYHAGLAGLDPATAAALGAFRHPAAYPSHLSAYPPTSLGLSLAYQQALTSYGRLAHPAAMGKGADGVCRDPYCTGCPSSLMTPTSAAAAAAVSASSPVTSSASGASCPAGCNQCDHQKTSIASSMITSTASSSAATTTSTSSSVSPNLASSRPYVCNWIAADQYCGKRFTSSEELLQHLRTHTSLSIPPANPVAPGVEPLASPSYSPLLNPSLAHSHLLASSAAAAALHRTYPTPPLSPLSMARYHPYSKPASASPLSAAAAAAAPPIGVPPASSGAAPPPPNPLLSLHNPYAGLGAYYSHPYSLYSQRMLAGAGVLP